MRTTPSRALALLLAALAVPAAASTPDQAIGSLLDAVAAGAPAFDGSRARASAVPVPVHAERLLRRASAPAALAAPAAPRTEDAPAAPTQVVLPSSARGISSGHIGLYSEDEFELGTGRCESCNGPREGKWYFPDDVIATPKSGPPAIVWIGSHELIEGGKLSADGRFLTLKDGSVVPFALTPQIASNRSFYDPSSTAFFAARTLRVRGEWAVVEGVRTLVARTIWPEDWRVDSAHLKDADAKNAQDIDALVGADKGGAKGPFSARLLWEKPGAGRDWDGKAVMGFMLNGAQGDDDEALAGHFSFFTGLFPAGGAMSDWMFDNFYSMDVVSEKGIVASMIPMDKYMADLNSGQSWYRPTDMLVLVMKDASVPLRLQEKFKAQYADYYAHKIVYDHTHKTCAALIVDPLRDEGWRVPEEGKTPWLIAKGMSKLAGGGEAGKTVFETLREEPTRVFPRQAFVQEGGDLLTLVGAFEAEPLGRELTPLEKEVRDGLLAILYVRLPQIPSSRAYGRDAVGGVVDYFLRTPKDRSKWKTVPSVPRPFPPAGAR